MFIVYRSDNHEVETILYDHRLITDEMKERGFFVDSLPTIDNTLVGKYGVLVADPATKTVSVEYRDRPLTPEEKLQLIEQENRELKNQIEIMQQAMDELLLGGM
ncbi:hypothetical protein [Geobacillus sp. CCR]